ncbi:HpcH/HpaI aldolase/citrate lyase family protein [Halorussus amylolyticus]|uniref:HpcH/HpaI aldolase/citrate lyase family protein n=1 Tax=Halorussus amylolyticus TaxID=1126242 RepID=UPI001045AFCF|nr:CoA ester lyase [Halorussus amylolyticus]
MTDRLRRSFLYTPADDPEMMAKAADTDADAVIFDLEDAVPDDAVPGARENVGDVLADASFGGTETCVRINGYRTDMWLDDLLGSVEAGIDTVILPMLETPSELETFVSVARQADGTTPEFVATVETPRGLSAIEDIADRGAAFSEVTALSFGFGDYTNAIGATGRPARVREHANLQVVGAAASAGLAPLATVYQDFRDTEGLREAAERAREIGYVGQKAIHPAQIEVLNDVYTPTDEEVEQARRFVETFAESPKDSIVVDGVFLDTAIVEQYETVLARHEEITGVSS